MCAVLTATHHAKIQTRSWFKSAAMLPRCTARTLQRCWSSTVVCTSASDSAKGSTLGRSTSTSIACSASTAFAPLPVNLTSQAHAYYHEGAEALSAICRYRALVLDSSYRPIDVVSWQRAICLGLFDKVDVLEYYSDDTVVVRSASATHPLPAVLRVRLYVQRDWSKATISLSRRNIMMRDKFSCQYCSTRSSLTIDHVIPMSKGGGWTWENLVTACVKCNGKKGNSTLKQLGWKLIKQPKAPSAYEVAVMAGVALSDVNSPPKEWSSYLFPGQVFNLAESPML